MEIEHLQSDIIIRTEVLTVGPSPLVSYQNSTSRDLLKESRQMNRSDSHGKVKSLPPGFPGY